MRGLEFEEGELRQHLSDLHQTQALADLRPDEMNR
jgi:hypothetical protein